MRERERWRSALGHSSASLQNSVALHSLISHFSNLWHIRISQVVIFFLEPPYVILLQEEEEEEEGKWVIFASKWQLGRKVKMEGGEKKEERGSHG